MRNDAPGWRRGAALPGYRPVRDAVLHVIDALSPPARITVSEAAERRKVNAGGHWKQWDNAVAPYMVEPQDATQSREFEAIVFVGPARSSKTESMIINPAVHSILAAPRLTAIFHMKQASAREFSVQDFGPIIRNSPEMAERLRLDNDHDKRFRGGARITIDWPVPNKLAGRSIPLVLLSDYDAMDQDVGGEGSPFALGRKRTTSAGSRAMTVAESSPRFPLLDDSWSPKTPHEGPPCDGIVGLYNLGTRARLYWTCPHCAGEFEPTVERMRYDATGTPAARGASAYMACLHCGGVIEQAQRAALNRAARWLHETPEGGLAPLGDRLRETKILSYWLPGPAAALAPWASIITRLLEGEELFEATADESGLKSAYNLDLGLPYRPKALDASAAISEEGLRDAATDHAWGVAPAGTWFVSAAIDVQIGRFVVQVFAWRANMERVLIDLFDIHAPPASAPRASDRQIDPARYGEDWAALTPLLDRVYDVAAADYGLRVAFMICDAAGAPGVTPNAYAYYRKMRLSHPTRFRLVKGVGGDKARRAEEKAPETAHGGKRKVARDVMIVRVGTDVLKSEVAASLTREDDGARSLRVPKGAPSEVFAEFAAERFDGKTWTKRPGVKRNEALDLAVYDLGQVIALGVEKIDPKRPPAWALPSDANAFAVRSAPLAAGGDPPQPQPRRRKRRRSGKRDFTGW